jgi:hypothetical protein
MKIFIPRVPKTVTPDDLRAFTANILDEKLHIPFTKHPNILSCDILRIRDAKLGLVEHHGLLSIRPETAGHWLINKITNRKLNSKPLYAREYHTRKDNRLNTSLEDERRRKHLEIAKINIRNVQFEGLD